jgi:hypothetical protein
MALLDYLFPLQQSDTITGLLGEDEARKIRQQSQTAGLLNLGANLLALSGPSSQQRSFGQMLAPSLLAGYQAAQGTTDSQLQQRLAAQKMERENAFRKAISESMVNRPTGTGLTDTSKGSQAEMLSRPEFGGEFAAQSTMAGLLSNPNLPTTRTLDQNKFMSALAEYNPLEFAKMQMQANKPGEDPLAKFKAFANLPPEQQQDYANFVRLTAPQTNITANLAEKGANEVYTDRLKEFSSAAATQRRFAQDANTINTLLKGKSGGELVKVGTTLAKDLGFTNDMISAQDLANSIAIRGATTMRAPGSGATSDLEFRAYQAAFPSLANSESGRAFMANASTKFAQRSAKIADYAMKLYKDGKYSEEAIAAYDQSLGSVIDLKEMERLSATAPSTRGGTNRRDMTNR